MSLDSIETALEALRNGQMLIVVDDEDRENEGDFICAADMIAPEQVDFMLRMVEARCVFQCQAKKPNDFESDR